MTWVSVLVLLGVLQGFILAFAISKIKKGNIKANKILTVYILLISLTLSGRFAYNYDSPSLFYFKILYLGDILIFLFGPMLYFYFLELFNIPPKTNIKKWVHFLPAVLFVLSIMPYVFADKISLIEMLKKSDLLFRIIELLAIIQNIIYFTVCNILLRKYLHQNNEMNSETAQVNFYKILLLVTGLGIFFWCVSFTIRIIDPTGSGDYSGYQTVWFSLSFAIFALGYYSLTNHDALLSTNIQKKYDSKVTGIENIDELSKTLKKIMLESKPYLKPKLTISELSQISGINTHLLSRIINEKFNKNFFEFINYYRIEDFKSLVKEDKNKHLTFLAIAFQVGFNSKTTFNTAFKKLEKKTPREYLNLA